VRLTSFRVALLRRCGEMADAADLNSAAPSGAWGFESLLRHDNFVHGTTLAEHDRVHSCPSEAIEHDLGVTEQ
jgi:hypothetical protein